MAIEISKHKITEDGRIKITWTVIKLWRSLDLSGLAKYYLGIEETYPAIVQEAIERGNLIHSWLELIEYEKLQRILGLGENDILHREMRFLYPIDDEFVFKGIIDLFVITAGGQRIVIDYKTSKKYRKDFGRQVQLYVNMLQKDGEVSGKVIGVNEVDGELIKIWEVDRILPDPDYDISKDSVVLGLMDFLRKNKNNLEEFIE